MKPHNLPYRLPAGFSTPRLLFRSIRYFYRNSIVSVTRNMEKLGDTYSAMFPGKQLVYFTQDQQLIQHVLRENHTHLVQDQECVSVTTLLWRKCASSCTGSLPCLPLHQRGSNP
nr:hypothetical protein [Deminuibacter soli]